MLKPFWKLMGMKPKLKTWLNQIRYRVGLPATDASGADLVEVYRNERRLELAYEERRLP